MLLVSQDIYQSFNDLTYSVKGIVESTTDSLYRLNRNLRHSEVVSYCGGTIFIHRHFFVNLYNGITGGQDFGCISDFSPASKNDSLIGGFSSLNV